ANGTNAASSASGAKTRSRPNNEYVLYSYGEPVAMTNDSGTSYFGTDILGSVRNITDKYGTVQADYSYDAFGSPYLGNLENDIGFGYCGKVYDVGTGLYDYGFRDYSPVSARFTTVDPIRDGSNWFSYVVNDPVNYVDPLGLSTSDRGSVPNFSGLVGQNIGFDGFTINTQIQTKNNAITNVVNSIFGGNGFVVGNSVSASLGGISIGVVFGGTSSSRGAGGKFRSIEESATDFARTYNDDSIYYNVEYFSAIYEETNQDTGEIFYSYNIPNKGNGNTVTIDLNVGENQIVVSTVHTHAAYDPLYDNNNPSTGDFDTMIGNNPEYVVTPNGSLIQYNTDGSQEVIRTDINSDKNDPSRQNQIYEFIENEHR
ncbi:MAG: DUF4329 domain-containing protein, partial [Spirochaetaceae bacterium]|nr:DUF4329 domain-containing protein [Spirochaetaceae bacterium]